MARVGKPRKFVFVCINKRPEEHPRPSCFPRGGGQVFEALRETTGRMGLIDVKVTATGCMEPCVVGPTVFVAPDNVWYGGVTVEDVPLICEQHLRDGEPVEWLQIGEDEFDLDYKKQARGGTSGLLPPTG